MHSAGIVRKLLRTRYVSVSGMKKFSSRPGGPVLCGWVLSQAPVSKVVVCGSVPRLLFSSSSNSPDRPTPPSAPDFKVASKRIADDTLSLEQMRKRIVYRAANMGTRENCLLCGSFAREFAPTMDRDELNQFADLLLNNDVLLYQWLSSGGSEQSTLDALPEEVADNAMLRRLVAWTHRANKKEFELFDLGPNHRKQ